MGYLDQSLHTYFLYCPATDMLNGEEGLLSINLTGRGVLVKMLITFEQNDIL